MINVQHVSGSAPKGKICVVEDIWELDKPLIKMNNSWLKEGDVVFSLESGMRHVVTYVHHDLVQFTDQKFIYIGDKLEHRGTKQFAPYT